MRLFTSQAVVLAGSFFMLAVSALAQPAALNTEFPPDAEMLEGDALRQRMAGKSFKTLAADGQEMRLQYKSDGFAFVDTSRGFRDTGKWRVEGKNVCVDWNRAPSGCSEARAKGEFVHIRRVSTPEVLTLKPN
jgi:hypothetical protein